MCPQTVRRKVLRSDFRRVEGRRAKHSRVRQESFSFYPLQTLLLLEGEFHGELDVERLAVSNARSGGAVTRVGDEAEGAAGWVDAWVGKIIEVEDVEDLDSELRHY